MNRQAEQIDIRNAADLVGLLQSGTLPQRLGILRSVAAHPERCLRYGRHRGRDVVDALIEAVLGQGTLDYREAVLAVLARFPDPRVRACLEKLIEQEDQATLVSRAARQLASWSASAGVREDRFLLKQLARNDVALQPRCAAAALQHRIRELPPGAQLRVAILIPSKAGEMAPDLFGRAFVPHWIEELRGIFAGRARSLARSRGVGFFRLMTAAWRMLDEAGKAWLLGWGAGENDPDVFKLTLQAMSGDSGENLLIACLSALERQDRVPSPVKGRLQALMSHPNPVVRRKCLLLLDGQGGEN